MARQAYLFEFRGIQSYLFNGGKLADMVCASNLLSQLCNSILLDVLHYLKIDISETIEPDSICLVRNAAGAIHMVSENRTTLLKFGAFWSFFVQQLAPGVEFTSVLGEGVSSQEAIHQGLRHLKIKSNQPRASLLIPGPYVMRSPRTGRGVVAKLYDSGATQWVDQATLIKRQVANKKIYSEMLGTKFTPDSMEQEYVWPDNFDDEQTNPTAFPFEGFPKLLALVYIDGNNIGECFIKLSKHLVSYEPKFSHFYSRFSRCLQEATQEAARYVTDHVLQQSSVRRFSKNILPARPLVLGGDDVLVLVRADLALDYSEQFIKAFEEKTERKFANFKKRMKGVVKSELINALPDRLSASGGICYIKHNQPFSKAYELVQLLAKEAKKVSSNTSQNNKWPIESSISFHYLKSSIVETSAQINENATKQVGHDSIQVSMSVYGLSDNGKLPALSKLMKIYQYLTVESSLPRSPLSFSQFRMLLSLLDMDENQATMFYKNMKSLAENQNKWEKLKRLLSELFKEDSVYDFLSTRLDDKTYVSPLLDLMTLNSLEKRHEGEVTS